jgi:imidazoleglycerol phosphate synthase glutamine amidotransferase subunit HisH
MVAAEGQSDWEHTIVCYFLDLKLPQFPWNNFPHKQDKDALMEFLSNENGLYFIKLIEMDAVNALVHRAFGILLIKYW